MYYNVWNNTQPVVSKLQTKLIISSYHEDHRPTPHPTLPLTDGRPSTQGLEGETHLFVSPISDLVWLDVGPNPDPKPPPRPSPVQNLSL